MELIKQAETEEERIKLLQQERNHLTKVVRFETRKSFLYEQQKEYIVNAKNALRNLSKNEEELTKISIDENHERDINPEINEIYTNIEKYIKTDSMRTLDNITLFSYNLSFLNLEIKYPKSFVAKNLDIALRLFANFLNW